jgi:hypothetical protein
MHNNYSWERCYYFLNISHQNVLKQLIYLTLSQHLKYSEGKGYDLF